MEDDSLHPELEIDAASSSQTLQYSVCDVCQGLYDKENPRGFLLKRAPHESDWDFRTPYIYTYIHHADLEAVFASAEAGCRLCAMIGTLLEPYRPVPATDCSQDQRSERPIAGAKAAQTNEDLLAAIKVAEYGKRERVFDARGLDHSGRGRIIITLFLDDDSQGRFVGDDCAEIRFWDGSDIITPWGWLYHFCAPYETIDPDLQHRPSNNLLSKQHIALINHWRRVCEKEHKSCRKTSLHQLLPSRVLEIIDPSDKRTGVRLVENQDEKRGTYACLSYCWGNNASAQAGQTTHSNLASQLQGISMNMLPNTVADAIWLCYELGIQFLWVDRLCILQDDLNDWSKEASRMCEVYSRSALTISVPICEESSESFLAKRRLGFREDSFVPTSHTDKDSTKMEIFFFTTPPGTRYGPWYLERDWYGAVSNVREDQYRWLQRRWTFQEWMLPPRVLHIGSITLWDCLDGYANEVFRRQMVKPRLSRNPENFGENISWKFIVEEYSRRRTTHEKDKLPALAGLAVRYAQATGDSYLAGLWRQDLPTSLLWSRKLSRGESGSTWPIRKPLPSWSWASSDGDISYHVRDSGYVEKAYVLSTFCQYNPPDSFSEVENAWIDIEGRISIVTAQRGIDEDSDSMYDGNVKIMAGGEWWTGSTDYGVDFPDDAIAQRRTYLLLIESNGYSHHGLVIEELEGDEESCYRRLGEAMLRGHYYGFESEWMKRVVRLV